MNSSSEATTTLPESTLLRKLSDVLRSRHAWDGALSVANQAVVSATNFVTTVLIGRMCGSEGLGTYYLAFTVVLLIRGFQYNLVALPYMVYWPHYRGRRRAAYLANSWVHLGVLSLVVMAALAAFGVLLSFNIGPPALRPLIGVLVATLPLTLFREHIRFLELSHSRMLAVNAIDLTVALVQIAGLLILSLGGQLTPVSAYWMIGIACAASLLLWLSFQRHTFVWRPELVRRDWEQNWIFGKWSLSSHLVGSSATLILPWFAAIGLNEQATGDLAACASIIGLTNVFVAGLDNFVAPRAAQAYARGGCSALEVWLAWIATAYVVGLGAFCVLIAFGGNFLLTTVFGEAYHGLQWVLLLLALGVLARSMRMTAASGLCAMHDPRANFVADIGTLATSVIAATWLVRVWGVTGLALASLLASIVGAVISYFALRNLLAANRRAVGLT